MKRIGLLKDILEDFPKDAYGCDDLVISSFEKGLFERKLSTFSKNEIKAICGSVPLKLIKSKEERSNIFKNLLPWRKGFITTPKRKITLE